MCERAWGSEFFAPDHGIYEWSGGRKFDSTDKYKVGVYSPNFGIGLGVEYSGPYTDTASALLLTEDGKFIDLG